MKGLERLTSVFLQKDVDDKYELNMNANKNQKYKYMLPSHSPAHKILYYTNEAMHAASRDIQIVTIKYIYI